MKIILSICSALLLLMCAACSPATPAATMTLFPTRMVTRIATSTATAAPSPSQTPSPTSTATHPPTRTVTASPMPSATSMVPQGMSILGYSTLHWSIEVHRFGRGPTNLVFIGGIHGGYEWNTILLAYRMISYFQENQGSIPPEVSLYIIPAANPDGQVLVVGHAGEFAAGEVGRDTVKGRFNAAGVDLNRNWDCNWSPTGQWVNREILTGTQPFSEVENRLLRDFLLDLPAHGVAFWHSAATGVYPGGCEGLYEPSVELAKIFAEASGYPYQESFTSYAVTGDAADWLSLQGIPAISVELSNHTDLDWEQNLQGVLAVLEGLKAGD